MVLKNLMNNPSGESMNTGMAIYCDLAISAGIYPKDALTNLPTMLGAGSWNDTKDFLRLLGEDDVAAILEARSHFGLSGM